MRVKITVSGVRLMDRPLSSFRWGVFEYGAARDGTRRADLVTYRPAGTLYTPP